MYLTNDQESMLRGDYGEAKQLAMELLVAIAKIYNAESLIPVTSVQVSGVSYKTIGDAGLEFIEHMLSLGAKVSVKTFMNPAGMDREQWQSMGIPPDFAKKQFRIFDAYEGMGISPTYTCTPYFVGLRPAIGEHVAWAESSAVVFANSVLGARTNREGGPSALMAAITGYTPNYGLHLDENRIADVLIKTDYSFEDKVDYGLFGLRIGNLLDGKFPAFENLNSPDEDKLKALGAAMAASGSVPIYFMKNVTPEFNLRENYEEIHISKSELEELKYKLSVDDVADLIAIGCPHASLKEIKEVVDLLEAGKKPKAPLWIHCAREIKKKAEKLGYVKVIEEHGGRVVADTCMVVSPIESMGYKVTAINSGKAAKYLPQLCKQKVIFDRIKKLI